MKPFINLELKRKLYQKKSEKNIQRSLFIRNEHNILVDISEISLEKSPLSNEGFSFVYKGKFRDQTVAVKKLKDLKSTDQTRREFENEVSILSKLNSNYIVRFFAAVIDQDSFYIVMDFMK